jgi:hypothetical protein
VLILAGQLGPYNGHAGLFLSLLAVVALAGWRAITRENRRHVAAVNEVASLRTWRAQ